MPTATILLAEDEEVVRRLVTEILRRAGYEVLDASNGAQALEKARAQTTKIDLLVSDVAMPAMTGLELARQIGAMHPGIKILLISGYSDPAAVADMQDQPGFAYLRKPFAPSALLEQVRNLLR